MSFFIILFLLLAAPTYSIHDTTIIVGKRFQEKGMIRVTGIGYPPSRISDERQARLLARRAAIVDGYRNLLKSFDKISGWIENRNIIRKEGGFLKGAKILNTRYFEDGKVEVDLGLDVTLRQDGLKKVKKHGYKIIYVSEITERPYYEVITKEEWEKLGTSH